MNVGRVQHIDLPLRHLDELFVAPQLDPFKGQFHTWSGIERLVAELQRRALVRPLHATIRIPADQLSEGIAERCKTALRGYCLTHIQQNELDKARVRRQGLKELRLGLLFLAACLLVSGWVDAVNRLPEFPRHFLSEGLVIVGWIALWHPVDLLLFERWSVVRDQRVHQCIHDMDLHVEAVA